MRAGEIGARRADAARFSLSVRPVPGEFRIWRTPENGNRLKLQEQPFRLLVILLEGGEVVTRDDLRHHIWREDTLVDFASSFRVAVRKLREALNNVAKRFRGAEFPQAL